MSGAQSWSVKGIDPKIREAAREAAARSGMSLGEYLSAALQSQQPASVSLSPPRESQPPQRMRSARFGAPTYEADDEEDWHVSGPTTLPRVTDPVRLAQRIDSIERRTQLAVTGLDRAVSTIDRSVLGLAARVEDAEQVSGESADRIAEALEHFRVAGDTLGGRLENAEREVGESRLALEAAHIHLEDAKTQLSAQLGAKERLEGQIHAAEEIARRAEAAASFLATELESRNAVFGRKLGALEDQTRDALSLTLSEARACAEEAARQAAEASSDAVTELRRLQEHMSERLTETENSARRSVETAIEQTRAEQAHIAESAARAEFEARSVKNSLLDEVVRLEAEIGARIAAADQLKSEQAALITRIERAEAGSREATAGLRQAAGAAIADLRNAQLTLAGRVKQVEEAAGRSGVLDLGELRAQQGEIADRLGALENQLRANPMGDALAAFENRLAEINARIARSAASEQVDGAVKTLDEALQRLAQRIAETESTANNAIRTLEETVSTLGAKVESSGAQQETEALRQMLEQRLDTMAQSVTQMVGEARVEIAGQVSAALDGAHEDGLEGALADVNRRLAGAERRQAQTIEAISIEIKRMSETVDRRLRAVESRNDDAAASAVREELSRMSTTLEHRFDEIEQREAAAFDRMGLEVGRLSERLEDRVGAVEGRSAQAIEQVGEQVARMAERFNHRHEMLTRDLGERMIDSEERAGARVSEAISSIMQRLSEVEEHSAEAMAPVKKAMSSVASRLEAYESGRGDDEIPSPTRRFSDYDAFENSAPHLSPLDAAQPRRAGPLPVTHREPPPSAEGHQDDIYFAETDEGYAPITEGESEPIAFADQDNRAGDGAPQDTDVFAPPPPEDDDPFWTPDEPPVVFADATPESAPASTARVDVPVAAPEPQPAGKNDYLNAARKAAQAQAAPKPGKKAPAKLDRHGVAPTPVYSLRGSSRIVLWGAASAIALLVAGGAWYLNARERPATAAEPAAPPAQAAAPAIDSYDPNAPFGAPVADPFATTAPADGANPSLEAAPPAAVAPGPAGAGEAVVAGPLPPRSVSLEQAAQSGNIVAQYELGLQRIAAGQREEGVSLLRQAANRGLAMAQYRLAKLYERGEGVPADLTQARQWTERAAAAGNRRAMHDLGVYFARGEGAPLDEAAAFRWFRQAAELGVADSQYNLGVLYQQGRGVGASAAEAMFWFLVAARQGDEDAGARAQTLEQQLQPIQIEQARARAEAFRPRAASAQANGEFGARTWAAPPRPAARPAA